MKKLLSCCSALLAGVTLTPTAHAQNAGGPEIAFVKVGGTTQEIYLVNPDGTGLKRLYAAGRKMAIGWIDLKPGGNEIAFTEYGNGSPRVIKVLQFDNSGNAIGAARTVNATCGVDTVDYHPTEPKLIISDFCPNDARIAAINTDGSGYSVLVTNNGSYLNKARWLMDGSSYVYVRAPLNGGQMQICRNACRADEGEVLRTISGNWFLDVGRTAPTIIHDYAGGNTTEINATTGSILRDPIVVGNGAHYSGDDTRVLFETPHSAKGDYLHILNANGTITRLTAKGEYGPSDWRK